jgi:hypothetical protein
MKWLLTIPLLCTALAFSLNIDVVGEVYNREHQRQRIYNSVVTGQLEQWQFQV